MINDNMLKKPRLLTRLGDERSGQVQGSQLLKSPRVHDFSHKDEFGWGFPEVEDVGKKKKNVIDMKWLNEYHDDINKLQGVIKRERSLSFSTQTRNLLAKKDWSRSFSIEPPSTLLKPDRSKPFCVQSRNLLESHSSGTEVSDIEESLESTQSFEIEVPENCISDAIQLNDHTNSDSLLEACEEETLERSNDEEARSSTPFTEAFCSMQSFVSRDSGISASDDLDIPDTPPEINTDCSLLEELEGARDSEQSGSSTEQSVSNYLELSEQSDQLADPLKASDKLTRAFLANVKHKHPVWYKRFSIGNINVNLSSFTCDNVSSSVVPAVHTCSKEDSYDSLSIGSEKETLNDNPLHETDCEDTRRRQRLRTLWSSCDKLEALSLRQGSTVRGLSEVTELVDTLSKISSRLEVLKYDLHDLSLQVSESHKELNHLEQKASDILESSVTSRHHMSQLLCLEKLQERLQEEWWAIHNPDLVTPEGNYIV